VIAWPRATWAPVSSGISASERENARDRRLWPSRFPARREMSCAGRASAVSQALHGDGRPTTILPLRLMMRRPSTGLIDGDAGSRGDLSGR
jgi:hypothetical protein